MPELKFSCAQCGQHISCDELWAGQQIQCPACKNTLVVPAAHAVPPPPLAATTPPQANHAPTTGRPKLASRATQTERTTQANVTDHRRSLPRPPKGENAPLKYAIIGVLLLALGGVAYHYVPGLLGKVHEMETPIGSSGPAAGGGGPLGEVNGAMDVSDAIDGNGGSRQRTANVRKATPGQSSPTSATNTAVKVPATKR